MALHSTGLGKGLDALIRETSETRGAAGVQTVSLDDIAPNPKQPRRMFDEKALSELADSIRSQGLLQPLLVRPADPARPGKYEIVAGERRWRASRMAGLKEVPVLIRSLSEQDVLAAALIENLQREDLNPMEEAVGLRSLKDEFGLSQDELAKKIGKSRSAIANSLRLLTLPEEAQQKVTEGKLSAGHARTLLSLENAEAQAELLALILEKNISVREAEGQVAIWKAKGRFELPGQEPHASEAAAGESPQQAAGKRDAARRPAKKPQSAVLLEAQNRIGGLFKVPVRVTGKEDKGKISFSFNSRDELEALLARLAAPALEGADFAVLHGLEQDSLDGQSRTAIGSDTKQALEGSGAQALSHRKSAALPHRSNQALESGAAETTKEPEPAKKP